MRCSVAFGITLRLLVINISSSSLAKHCSLNYYQRRVTSSLTIWPNSEFRLLAMTSRTEGRLVRSTTSVILTKSCQRISRIIRWQCMWKTSSFRRSSCRSVHVSETYNKMTKQCELRTPCGTLWTARGTRVTSCPISGRVRMLVCILPVR